MILFLNRNPQKNIGKATNKQFAITFIENDSYYVYTDGTIKLAKKDALWDKELFEKNCLDPSGELIKFEFERFEELLLSIWAAKK